MKYIIIIFLVVGCCHKTEINHGTGSPAVPENPPSFIVKGSPVTPVGVIRADIYPHPDTIRCLIEATDFVQDGIINFNRVHKLKGYAVTRDHIRYIFLDSTRQPLNQIVLEWIAN